VAVALSAAEGARVDGVLGGVAGAVNTLNPLYTLGVAGVETKIGIENGDIERATEGAATGVFIIGSVFVGGRGAGAAEGAEAGAGAARGLVPGEAGSFASLDARAIVGDALEPHHMPQAALKFTSRGDGGALVLPKVEHVQTRTYGAKGIATRNADAGRPFRSVLARDIRDVRSIVGTKYDAGLRSLLEFYYENHPELIGK
jgi:hypothetical protein